MFLMNPPHTIPGFSVLHKNIPVYYPRFMPLRYE
jgi:hypothetical protein